jgi:uncharacterized protein YjiS (DUF1127 family)
MSKIIATANQPAFACRPAASSRGPAYAPGSLEQLDAACARLLRSIDRAGRVRPAKELADYLVAVWRRYLTWQARRATRILLNALDDRMLRDIGLQRGEIASVASEIEWQRLRRWA